MQKIVNCNLFKNLKLGIDPRVFTSEQINRSFLKFNSVKILDSNLIDQIFNKYSYKSKPFYSLPKKVVGESFQQKLTKLQKY